MRRRLANTRFVYAGLSVVIATVMWLYVATAQNPLVERIMTLDLHVRGLGAAEVVVQAPSRVQVHLQGPRSALALLTPALLDASVDLSGFRPGEHRAPVYIAAPPEVRIVERTPAEAVVVLDALMRQRLAVEVSLIGVPPPGVTLGTPRIQPDRVTISGAATQVEEVRHVVVTLDISQLRQQLISSVPVHLLDATGQEVRGLTVDPSIVQATMPVREGTITKVVPVVPALVGSPASGLAVTGVTITPETVVVSGSVTALQVIQTATTGPIDIGGARGDVTRKVSLALPPGSASSTQQVTVVVRVGRMLLSRMLSGVPVRISGVPKGSAARATPDRVDVQVEGPQDAVQRLAPSGLVAEVDASGPGRGSRRVTPRIALPSGVRVLAIAPTQITLTVASSP
ncbi:MAG TPA: CdaR family protein [bacterium]|nr:CdaR family protein [bacterium]